MSENFRTATQRNASGLTPCLQASYAVFTGSESCLLAAAARHIAAVGYPLKIGRTGQIFLRSRT